MANMIRRQEPSSQLYPFRGHDPMRMMRDLMRWDPFQDLGFTPRWGDLQDFSPSFDMKETKDALVVHADLPGLTEKDVNISVTGNRLTISGERKAEEQHEEESHYAMERSYGAFARTFALPDEVDADKVQAELKNGVLKLTMPKRPEAKARQIPLRTARD
jgi:HSP20 family protein